jgi:sulfur-oxidizing protein SoxX
MNLIKSLPIALAFGCLISTASFADSALVKKGEKIFKTKKLANCVACHDVNGKADIKAMGPGSMGPKLQNLSAWPEKALYEKIYNPYTTNPVSQMPAFGKSGWLSDSEIKALVAYLKTVN